jgi:hypothetical protein
MEESLYGTSNYAERTRETPAGKNRRRVQEVLSDFRIPLGGLCIAVYP